MIVLSLVVGVPSAAAQPLITVSDGDAEGGVAAVTVFGRASGGVLSVSAFGTAEGSDECAQVSTVAGETCLGGDGGTLVASGTGSARGRGAAISGIGNADCSSDPNEVVSCAALSGIGVASCGGMGPLPCLALAPGGEAYGDVAISEHEVGRLQQNVTVRSLNATFDYQHGGAPNVCTGVILRVYSTQLPVGSCTRALVEDLRSSANDSVLTLMETSGTIKNETVGRVGDELVPCIQGSSEVAFGLAVCHVIAVANESAANAIDVWIATVCANQLTLPSEAASATCDGATWTGFAYHMLWHEWRSIIAAAFSV